MREDLYSSEQWFGGVSGYCEEDDRKHFSFSLVGRASFTVGRGDVTMSTVNGDGEGSSTNNLKRSTNIATLSNPIYLIISKIQLRELV